MKENCKSGFYLEHGFNRTLTTIHTTHVTILTFLSSTIPFSTITSRHLLRMVFNLSQIQ